MAVQQTWSIQDLLHNYPTTQHTLPHRPCAWYADSSRSSDTSCPAQLDAATARAQKAARYRDSLAAHRRVHGKLSVPLQVEGDLAQDLVGAAVVAPLQPLQQAAR